MFAIAICGAYGKSLTLIYLNYFLIKAGYKVLFLNLTSEKNIKSIYVNNINIEFEKKDEFKVLEDVYNQYDCDVVLTKSSHFNPYLSIIISGVIRIDRLHPIDILEDRFIIKNFPVVITTQTEEVAKEIYSICLTKQAPAFVSEHYHTLYKKHNIGLDISYAYQCYCLALSMSEIFKEMHPKKGVLQLVNMTNLKRVKPNGSYFYSYPLPSTLPIVNMEFNNYYGSIVKKGNTTFYLDACNNATASNYVSKWFEMDCNSKDAIKLGIFYKEPSNDLIHTMLPISTINYETFYIVDYDTYGNTYDNLRRIFFEDIFVIGENVPWVQTNYECISGLLNETAYENIRRKYNTKAGHFNIVVDKLEHIQSWIAKYTEAHNEADFRVLITGSKKIVDDMLSYINIHQ
jgi:hypothetical protein